MLRNQLSLYRKSRQRPRIRPADRLLWCLLAKFWAGWRAALYFVQPRSVMTWQKKRFRDHWRALSQPAKPGRPRVSRELRKLISRMWEANPTWGSPKIVAELAMLGIDVAKSTVEKYQPKRAGSPSPTWKTFLDQHVRDLVSIDFFIVPTATFRVLFVFIVLAHHRRRIVHFNVTEHPTAQWAVHNRLVEAFPFDTAPQLSDSRRRWHIRSSALREGSKAWASMKVVTAPCLAMAECLCGTGDRYPTPRTPRPRRHSERAASQETLCRPIWTITILGERTGH